MIYMRIGEQGEQFLIVLEPGNLAEMQEGRPLATPDRQVMVCYTPDVEWLSVELRKLFEGTSFEPVKFDALLKESLKRKPIFRAKTSTKRVI